MERPERIRKPHINTGANNYQYDELGNLIHDELEDIERIDWTVSGKVLAVHRPAASGKQNLIFLYGAGGQRIMKYVMDDSEEHLYTEHYIRDAQGNVMATYRYTPGTEASFKLTERPIYGSSRLGVDAHTLELGGLSFEDPNPYLLDNPIGLVKYELTDHLGNVAAVITDELLGVNVDGGPENEYFQPNLISASLHEPFGMNLTGMNWQSDVARFGFQNQLKDVELGLVNFKYREYGPDGSGFLTIDPLAAKYPHNSPYAFSENRVIDKIELEGLETEEPPPPGTGDFNRLPTKEEMESTFAPDFLEQVVAPLTAPGAGPSLGLTFDRSGQQRLATETLGRVLQETPQTDRKTYQGLTLQITSELRDESLRSPTNQDGSVPGSMLTIGYRLDLMPLSDPFAVNPGIENVIPEVTVGPGQSIAYAIAVVLYDPQ